MTLNAIEVLQRVRQKTHDRDGLSYDDNETLAAVDDALRETFTPLRTHGEMQEADSLNLTLGQLTLIETGVYQWELFDYVADVKMMEATRSGSRGVPIPHVTLEEKDVVAPLCWHWGPRGSLQVRGNLVAFQGLRVWYIRQSPPMTWLIPITGSTTTATVSGATVRGALKNRDDIYVGMRFEATAGSSANIGQVRRCTGFTAGVFTFEAWPATTALCTLAMILPLPDENVDFLAWLVAEELLSRSGSSEYLDSIRPKVARLRDQFLGGISRRTSGEPPRLTSSRRYR